MKDIKISKPFKILLIVIGASIVLIAAFYTIGFLHDAYVQSQIHYAQPVGKLVLGNNDQLNKIVTAWETPRAETSFNIGRQDPVKAKCKITIYGYDAEYIYANSECDSIENSPTGWSVPTRFSYDVKTMQVTGETEQGEDNINPSISDIFPREVAQRLDR